MIADITAMDTSSPTLSSAAGPATALDLDQLEAAVAAARERFASLRAKHPQLRGYLVFCLPGKQAGITTSPSEILATLPAMVIDDAAKSALQAFLRNPPDKSASEKDKQIWNEQLHALTAGLRYRGDYRIEIRFDHLDYTLIARLQSDELVDRELTPLTRASIRIVLGTLAALAP
jgi:formate dehydrogenase maturation protein FdhE